MLPDGLIVIKKKQACLRPNKPAEHISENQVGGRADIARREDPLLRDNNWMILSRPQHCRFFDIMGEGERTRH
jgi:hypothetical protein